MFPPIGRFQIFSIAAILALFFVAQYAVRDSFDVPRYEARATGP